MTRFDQPRRSGSSVLERARARRRDLTTQAWRETRGRPKAIVPAIGHGLSPRSDADVLAVDRLLTELERLDPFGASLVELRFFGGLDLPAAAAALGRSRKEAEREWVVLRAWFRDHLDVDTVCCDDGATDRPGSGRSDDSR